MSGVEDQVFATSLQQNGEGVPVDGWDFAEAAPSVKKSKKKKKVVVEEPQPAPKKKKKAAVSLVPEPVQEPVPEPEPEPELEPLPESVPLAKQPTSEWNEWVVAAAPVKKSKKSKKGVPVVLPESPKEEPHEEPREELVAVKMPQVVVESPPEVVLTSDSKAEEPPCSPYITAPVTIRIGANETPHYVPRHLLPSQLSIHASNASFPLADINLETGHTLIHYLYTGKYDTLDTPLPSSGLKQAVRVYIIANIYQLLDLQHLATHVMEIYAAQLTVFEVLDAIKDDFTQLERDSYVHGLVRAMAKVAFKADHSVFRNEAFLKTLDNVVLVKFVMDLVMELYDHKIARMLEREKYPNKKCNHALQNFDSDCEGEHCGELNVEDFVTPTEVEGTVEECRGEDKLEQGSVSTDGFCTISCPSEEGGGVEDDVVVQETDLSRSVEQISDEWEREGVIITEEVSAAEKVAVGEIVDAAEPAQEPEAIKEEPAIDPFAGLSKMQRIRLRKQMRMLEMQKEEEAAAAAAAELCRQEEEAEAARLAAEEAEAARVAEEEGAKVREEEEAAAAAPTVAVEPEPVSDAEPKVCRLRARHMLKEKRWLKCKSCRTFMQQVAVRLSRADLDEENLQDMENVLII